jgi:mRNA interferase HigB
MMRTMRVIAKAKLVAFWDAHPSARRPLQAWYEDARRARWLTPQDIKRQYAGASFLPGRRVVFNIKGNDYRLVVGVAYRQEALFVKFVGTHSEYDAIAAGTVEPSS